MSRRDLIKIAGDALRNGYRVYAPVKQEAGVLIAAVEEPEQLAFDHILTLNTLKDVMLPRCESLARFDLDKQEVIPVSDDPGRMLIIGTRPCDVAAMAILDPILIGQVKDTRYARRRDESVIMTVACSDCDDACFCVSMGYGPHDTTGSDVIALPREGSYIVRAVTEKGRAFLGEMGIKEDEGGEPDAPPVLRRTLDTGGLKPWLDENFDSPRWRTVSDNCVSCGTCYYLCPTCHCFDIADEKGISRAERLRIWDSCSFSGFTRMASHQPRVGRHARYRQRVMHKFKYCVENIDRVACVGDGRCVRYCPYGVDICEILETLPRKE
ncbi:MAG: 4Fe-4S dicluster domain-containing protein [Candidatus Eisenbacteria bacterium]